MNRPRVQRTWGLFSKLICLLLCYNFFCTTFTYSAQCKPVTNGKLPTSAFVMPTIFWNPRNPLFYCPGKGINTINVRINDYIRLVCQKPGRLIDWHDSLTVPNTEMHGVAYMTENEAQFGQCIADASLKPLLTCSDPVNGNLYRTVRLAQHSGSSSDPLFVPGRTYYLLDTSTGESSSLNKRAGGRCNSSTGLNMNNMKLKIRVCPEGEAGTAKCPVCLTGTCYNYGCGTYSEWKNTDYNKTVNGSCVRVQNRVCDYNGGLCDGPSDKLVKAANSSCHGSGSNPKLDFNTTVTRIHKCAVVCKKICMNGNLNCSEEQKRIVVNESLCNVTSSTPAAGGRYVDESKMVSMVAGMFVLSLLATGITGMFVGILGAMIFVKKYQVQKPHHEGPRDKMLT